MRMPARAVRTGCPVRSAASGPAGWRRRASSRGWSWGETLSSNPPSAHRTLPMLRIALPCALACLFAGSFAAQPALAQAASDRPDLTTVAERSGFQRTGRYEEVIALCDAFARAYPDAVRCETFGTSPEGRPMKLLVATRSG